MFLGEISNPKSRSESTSNSEHGSPTLTTYRNLNQTTTYDSGVDTDLPASEKNTSPKRFLALQDLEKGKSSEVFSEDSRSSIETRPVIPLSGRIFDHTNPNELKPFVCNSCNCGFAEINSLRAHIRHSHPKKSISTEVLSCAYCNQSFDDVNALRQHFEYEHEVSR